MRTSSKLACAKSRLIAGTFAAMTALSATAAFAECDEDQEAIVGKLVAAAAAARINPAVPGAGKQIIDLVNCDYGSGGLVTNFKFNVLGSDGLYWAQGKAKIAGTTVSDLKLTTLSPNLAAASTAKGIKLASN